jgi:hypothetical protein
MVNHQGDIADALVLIPDRGSKDAFGRPCYFSIGMSSPIGISG